MHGRRIGALGVFVAALALVTTSCTDAPSPMSEGLGSAADTSTDHAGMDHGEMGHTGVGSGDGDGTGAPPSRHTGPQGRVGQFVTDCAHSHSAPDDPIVHPGYPGRSHQHDFFGNTSTDAFSTHESLLGEPTTCQKQLDTASYWAPALIDDGREVTPTKSTAYYRAAPGVDPADVTAYPPGLMIVAGDMTATSAQPTDLAGWSCGSSSRHHAEPPNCPASAPLHGVITFPDCWDGEHVDSEDHRSHMANSVAGACPDSHPVHVPQLTFAIAYPISGADHDLTLASGSTYGLHSDFFNAWDQDGLENEVGSCIQRDIVCGLSSNRGEDPIFSGL